MIEVENILQGDVLQDTIPLLEEVQPGDLLLLATKEDHRERSSDRHDGDRDRDDRDTKDHERSIQDSTFEEDGSNKKSKKEKKAKKSKKKNKKKDRDSDTDDEDKENKKKKKKDKKKKDKESIEKEAESEGDDADESIETKNEEIPAEEEVENKSPETEEKTSPKVAVDSSKFINSFSVGVDVKPKHNLPTLVFNDKTVELAPKNGDPVDETTNNELDDKIDDHNDSELLETGLSKWDKDEFYDETRKLSEPAPSQEIPKEQEDVPGPQSILKKALVNMEKDHYVREKKRKSLEGESEEQTEESHQRKKKKKRRASSIQDSTFEEDGS